MSARAYRRRTMIRHLARAVLVAAAAGVIVFVPSTAPAQSDDPPCPPGVPATAGIRGYDVEDRGGPLTATHTIRLDTYDGDRLVHHADITLPPGATRRGSSFEPAFQSDTAGSVPVSASWPHFDRATATSCTATAEATLQLAAPRPLTFIRSKRRGRLHLELRPGKNADLRPAKLVLRGVRRARLPGPGVRARDVAFGFREGDSGREVGSLRTAGWVFEFSAFADGVFVRGEIPFEETSRGRRGFRRGFGYTIRLEQAGRRIGGARVTGHCEYAFCGWRFR